MMICCDYYSQANYLSPLSMSTNLCVCVCVCEMRAPAIHCLRITIVIMPVR